MTRGEDPAAVAIRALAQFGLAKSNPAPAAALGAHQLRRFIEALRPRLPRKGGRPTAGEWSARAQQPRSRQH
jgi:hypothetical protein